MVEKFDINKYRTGYSSGVGGVVLCNNKVLLVRSKRRGEWSIPGGFVERDETIDIAIKREIAEEAGVEAEIQGLIAARNRISDKENSAYFVFLLQATSEATRPDNYEVDAAQYFTQLEVQNLAKMNALSNLIITRVFEGKVKLLGFQPHPTFSPDEYILFV